MSVTQKQYFETYRQTKLKGDYASCISLREQYFFLSVMTSDAIKIHTLLSMTKLPTLHEVFSEDSLCICVKTDL